MADVELALFDDFSGGDWGVDLDGSMAPKNSFSGTNVVVYRSGLIGPRPGYKKITVTSMPNSRPTMVSIQKENGAAQVVAHFTNGNVYTWNPSTPTAAAQTEGTAISAAYGTSKGGMIAAQNSAWGISFGDSAHGVWLATGGGTLTKVTSGPSTAGQMAVFNGRLWVAEGFDGSSTPNRVYYSNALAFATFASTTDYVDIGANKGSYILALIPLRNALYAFTQSEVYAITGTPGSTLATRKVSDVPLAAWGAFSRTYAGLIGLVSNPGIPHLFDGASMKAVRERRLTSSTSTGGHQVVRAGAEGLVFMQNSLGINATPSWRLFDGKAWSHHTFSKNAGDMLLWGAEMMPGNVNDYALTATANPIEDFMVGVNRISDSGAPEYYLMRVANFTGPGIASSNDSQPGDGSDTPLTGSFTLPDIYSGDGSILKVSKVTVHFRKYATGAGNAAFTVSLTPIGKYESGVGSAQTFSFSEAVPGSDTDDVYRTPGFSHDLEAEGFRLAFTGISCAGIRRVVVMGQKVPARP